MDLLMPPPGPARTQICHVTLDLQVRCNAIDLAALRGGFSELFDRAALHVQRAGHDLDDVVVERFLTCHGGTGEPVDVPIEFLSSLDLLLQQLRGRLGPAEPLDSSALTISGLGMRVWLDRPG
jgi:hypothetical protein